MNTDVRWLSDTEQRVWREFLSAMGALNEHLERRLQADAGMPHTYYEVLVSLSEAPDRTLRMSELATASRFSRSRLSHAVAKMEAKGWVRRHSCPTDKRGALATLTDEGFRILESAAPGHVESVREVLFDALTDEQVRQLGEISHAINATMAPICAAVADEDAADQVERPVSGVR